MKYLIILLSVFAYSCTKAVVPNTPACLASTLEVVSVNPHFYIQVYINGAAIGSPIGHW